MRSFSMTSGLVDAMEPEGEDQFFDLSLVQKPLTCFPSANMRLNCVFTSTASAWIASAVFFPLLSERPSLILRDRSSH
jgi:hypothetical protein